LIFVGGEIVTPGERRKLKQLWRWQPTGYGGRSPAPASMRGLPAIVSITARGPRMTEHLIGLGHRRIGFIAVAAT